MSGARRVWAVSSLLSAMVIALCLAASAQALAGETGSTDEYAGVARTDSVLLDPFDPVPQIQFGHGCGDHCGAEWRCREDCHWHGWYCPHDCYDMLRHRDGAYNVGWWRCANECRDGDWWCDHECRLEGWYCAHDCFVHEPCVRDCRGRRAPTEGERCLDVCYGKLIHEYEERLVRSDEQAHRYDDQSHRYEEQSHWYFEHVMDRHEHEHFGPPPGGGYGPPPPPPGLGPGYDHSGPPGLPPPPGGSGYGPPPPPPPGPSYGPGPGAGGPPPAGPGGMPPGPGPGDFGPGGPGAPPPGTPPPPPPH